MDRVPATVVAVIPTYNRAHLVGQAVDSLVRQSRPPDQIIVIDDGSTDETAGAVRAFGHRVRYIKQENTGKAAALNRALAEANADYVWQMDDDDVALPDALQSHLDFLATHVDIDFSYGAHYDFSGDKPPTSEWLRSQQPLEVAAVAPDYLFLRAMLWFPFYLQSMLVPLRCYEQVGPFNQTLRFCEDFDMIIRLARQFRGAGIGKPVFCLRVHSGHRGPSSGRISSDQRHATFRRYDRQIFARLYTELPLFEYLPRGAPRSELNEAQRREALLQRACIMARHGLFESSFADLAVVLCKGGDLLLGGRDRAILKQMLNVDPWWLRFYPEYTASLGRLLRHHQADRALRACATGLGWRLENSIRRRQYASAARAAANLTHLVGMARLPAFAAKTLVQRYWHWVSRSNAKTRSNDETPMQ